MMLLVKYFSISIGGFWEDKIYFSPLIPILVPPRDQFHL